MKKTIILTLLIAAATPLRAQIPHSQRERIHVAPHMDTGRVETDIFGDLRYRTPRDGYTAALKKDIFDNLTFTDSRRNRIVFDSDYLDIEYPDVRDDARAREDFLRGIVARHSRDEGYEATFDIDIFGTVTMRDNRGNEMRFDHRTWNTLVHRHGSEERVLLFLVDEFLSDRF